MSGLFLGGGSDGDWHRRCASRTCGWQLEETEMVRPGLMGGSRLQEMHLIAFHVVCWSSWRVVDGGRVLADPRLLTQHDRRERR